ncbi:hypothetical protein D3C86_985810 [compost metagenome]
MIAAHDMGFQLITSGFGVSPDTGKVDAVERTLHDDVVFACEHLGEDFCAELPDKVLGVGIRVQYPQFDHVGVLRVLFSVFGQVQSNIIGVAPRRQQAFFQQVGFT